MTDQINKELNKKYKTNKVHLYYSSRLRQQLSHQPTNSCRAEPWCCVGPERRERSTVSSVNLTRRQFGCGSAVLGVKDEQKRRKDTALWGASGGIVSERILLTNTLCDLLLRKSIIHSELKRKQALSSSVKMWGCLVLDVDKSANRSLVQSLRRLWKVSKWNK